MTTDPNQPAGNLPDRPPQSGPPAPPPPPPPGSYGGPPSGGYAQPAYAPGGGQKSFIATWLLAWFLGTFGIDRFYLGKVGTGILKLVTLGGCGVWWLIDLILTLAGAQKDKDGRPLEGYEQHKKVAWIITAVAVCVSALAGALNNPVDIYNDMYGSGL